MARELRTVVTAISPDWQENILEKPGRGLRPGDRYSILKSYCYMAENQCRATPSPHRDLMQPN